MERSVCSFEGIPTGHPVLHVLRTIYFALQGIFQKKKERIKRMILDSSVGRAHGC